MVRSRNVPLLNGSNDMAYKSPKHGPLKLLTNPAASPNLATKRKQGYVYFAKSGDAVKIGFSTNPKDRLHSIQTGCAAPAKMVKLIRGTHSTERQFHRRFAEYNLKGEWFDLRGRLAKYLENFTKPVEWPEPIVYRPTPKELIGYF